MKTMYSGIILLVVESKATGKVKKLVFSECLRPFCNLTYVFEVRRLLNLTKLWDLMVLVQKLLHACATPLMTPVTLLFNICVNTASFPVEWKSHLIVPVFKSGNISLVSNYRPILPYCALSPNSWSI